MPKRSNLLRSRERLEALALWQWMSLLPPHLLLHQPLPLGPGNQHTPHRYTRWMLMTPMSPSIILKLVDLPKNPKSQQKYYLLLGVLLICLSSITHRFMIIHYPPGWNYETNIWPSFSRMKHYPANIVICARGTTTCIVARIALALLCVAKPACCTPTSLLPSTASSTGMGNFSSQPS